MKRKEDKAELSGRALECNADLTVFDNLVKTLGQKLSVREVLRLQKWPGLSAQAVISHWLGLPRKYMASV